MAPTLWSPPPLLSKRMVKSMMVRMMMVLLRTMTPPSTMEVEMTVKMESQIEENGNWSVKRKEEEEKVLC